jgi:hypothetical protein
LQLSGQSGGSRKGRKTAEAISIPTLRLQGQLKLIPFRSTSSSLGDFLFSFPSIGNCLVMSGEFSADNYNFLWCASSLEREDPEKNTQ